MVFVKVPFVLTLQSAVKLALSKNILEPKYIHIEIQYIFSFQMIFYLFLNFQKVVIFENPLSLNLYLFWFQIRYEL